MRRIVAAASLAALLGFGLMGCVGPGGDAGTNGAPEAPASQDAKEGAPGPSAGAADQGGEARARQLMEGLLVGHLENVTAEGALELAAGEDGVDLSSVMKTRAMINTLGAEPQVFVESSTTPAGTGSAMAIWAHGNEAVIEVDGEVERTQMKDGYADQLMGPTGGSDQARAIYEAAEELSWSREGSLEVVRVTADPEALTRANAFSQVSAVESCEAEYSFDEQGRLVRCILAVEGPSPDYPDVMMTLHSRMAYSDYGTTVVPSYPDRG